MTFIFSMYTEAFVHFRYFFMFFHAGSPPESAERPTRRLLRGQPNRHLQPNPGSVGLM